MTPLEWLGGVARDDTLFVISGTWRDEHGSVYHLQRSLGLSINVLTIRPSGKRIYTKNLVRQHGCCTLWGSASKAFISDMDGDRLTWNRGKKQFTWHKLQ